MYAAGHASKVASPSMGSFIVPNYHLNERRWHLTACANAHAGHVITFRYLLHGQDLFMPAFCIAGRCEIKLTTVQGIC